MTDTMRKRLYVAAYDAIADECRHIYADPHAIEASLKVLDDHLRCPDCLRQAVTAVQATLTVLVDEHFPDDDVEYVYSCEGLAMDACEVLREIRGGA
jgi:hypothetical protein